MIFSILHEDVIFWEMLLNKSSFKYETLILIIGNDRFYILDLFYHFLFGKVELRFSVEVWAYSWFEVYRFSNINNLSFLVEKLIDSWWCRDICYLKFIVHFWCWYFLIVFSWSIVSFSRISGLSMYFSSIQPSLSMTISSFSFDWEWFL